MSRRFSVDRRHSVADAGTEARAHRMARPPASPADPLCDRGGAPARRPRWARRHAHGARTSRPRGGSARRPGRADPRADAAPRHRRPQRGGGGARRARHRVAGQPGTHDLLSQPAPRLVLGRQGESRQPRGGGGEPACVLRAGPNSGARCGGLPSRLRPAPAPAAVAFGCARLQSLLPAGCGPDPRGPAARALRIPDRAALDRRPCAAARACRFRSRRPQASCRCWRTPRRRRSWPGSSISC